MQIEQTSGLEIIDLYEKIGIDISTELGLGDLEKEDYIDRGKNWFETQKKSLQLKVCQSNTAAIVLKDDRKWDQILLIAAIADLISSVLTNISPITVAALIAKEGLHRFCEKK